MPAFPAVVMREVMRSFLPLFGHKRALAGRTITRTAKTAFYLTDITPMTGCIQCEWNRQIAAILGLGPIHHVRRR
jgi:hypothetical protein